MKYLIFFRKRLYSIYDFFAGIQVIRLFALVFLLLYSVTEVHARVPETRETEKSFDWFATLEFNYSLVGSEPFYQLVLIPEFSVKAIDLGIGFYFPLGIDKHNDIQTIDYNSQHAIYDKLYYLQYGYEKKSPVYVKVSQIEDYSLGYGFLVQRYSNAITYPEIRKLGAQIQVKQSGIEFDGILGDVSSQSVLGGRLSVRVGDLLSSKSSFLNSIVIGGSFVSDIHPKNREMVLVRSFVDREIVRKEESSDSLLMYGGDVSLTFLDKPFLKAGVYSEFGMMNLAGYGVGYGVFGTIYPALLDLDYRFQFRHLFNSFTPSYFNARYDVMRSSEIDRVGTSNAKLGWFLEISRAFYEKLFVVSVAYDETFSGTHKPHLYIKLSSENKKRRFRFSLQYNRFDFQSLGELFELTHVDSLLLLEISWGVTPNAEFAFAYRKGLIIEQDPLEETRSLSHIIIYTKIMI